MFNFSFCLSNPWNSRWSIVLNKNGTLTKNKAWEFNIYKTNTVLNVETKLSFRSDHAGLQIQFGLLGYEAEFHVYDTRHWDNNINDWARYD